MFLNSSTSAQSSNSFRVNYFREAQHQAYELLQNGKGSEPLTQHVDEKIVSATDARTVKMPQGIEAMGFTLKPQDYQISNIHDDTAVEQELYSQVIESVKTETNASEVFIFDHTIRAAADAESNESMRAPVKTVHNDYSDTSGKERFAKELEKHGLSTDDYSKFHLVNVWIPLVEVVKDTPLLFADPKSIIEGQLQHLKVRYPDRVGEVEAYSYSENNQWYFFSEMTNKEQLMFKVYDSNEQSLTRRVPHVAAQFTDAETAKVSRTSIELRSLVLFK